VLAAGLAFSGGAQAATCGTSAGLDTTNVSISSLNGMLTSIDATDCAGTFAGNDTGNTGTLISNLNGGIFAGFINNWSVFGKSDESGSGVDAEEDQVTGDWAVNFLPSKYSVFAVSLKAATEYAVYLFDLRNLPATETAAGAFNMLGLLTPANPNNPTKPRNTPELSHLTIAVYDDAPAPVPLPAAGWLLVAGLGALAAVRRRKG
jgi:hypothetical protein